jgi:hypothetical protein
MAAKKPLAPLAQRVKTDPALLARVLANPGLRGQLPDKYLSPTQLQARKQNQYVRDIGDIGTPLSGTSLVNAATQAVKSEFDPLLANIGRNEQVVNKSAGIQGDWAKRYYGDLSGLLGGIVGAQDTANAAAMKDVANRGQATQGAISAADQAAQQRLAQDAAVRGSDVQGSAPADLAARTAQQQGLAAMEAARNAASTSSFGGAQAAFLRGLQGATAQQGGEYQQTIANNQMGRLNELGQQRADLNTKQQGAFTDTLLKLRQNETQNAITSAGLLSDQQRAQLGAASDAASLAERQRHNRAQEANQANDPSKAKTKAELDYFKAHGYWPPTGPPKKGKGGSGSGGGGNRATNVQVGAAQDGTTSALADAKSLFKSGIKDRHQLAAYLLKGSKGTTQVVYDTKTGKPKLNKDGTRVTKATGSLDKHDPLWTSVALDVLIDGHVSRYNANRLHSRGLKVEDLGFPSYGDYTKKKAESDRKDQSRWGKH